MITSYIKYLNPYKFLFLMLLVTNVCYSSIHEPKGHERIEKDAYKLLKAQKANEYLPDGLTIYNYLVKNNIIKDDNRAYSAFPDLDLGRQFLSDRQIYHFMANSEYVIEAINKYSNVELQKRHLLKKALPDCLNMTYTLFREIVDNNIGANQAGRGIYVLIHAIADSYSREHTIRDSKNFNIKTIKSWQLSKLIWPKAAKKDDIKVDGVSNTKVFLHTTKGSADSEWEDSNGNLTPEATEAVKAIKDLFVHLYLALQNQEDSDQIAIAYMIKYFMPANAQIKNNIIEFNDDDTKILLSYKKGYNDKYQSNVMKMDRYPKYSHMFSFQEGLNDKNSHSFGYEFGYQITPTAAFSNSSLVSILRRIPYGFSIAVNENTSILSDVNFLESIQIKGAMKAMFYLPFNNVVMEGKVGYGTTPFYSKNNNSGILLGVDFKLNFGSDFTLLNNTTKTMNLSIGYEYDSSALHSYNSIILKVGFNSWQGRIIKY